MSAKRLMLVTSLALSALACSEGPRRLTDASFDAPRDARSDGFVPDAADPSAACTSDSHCDDRIACTIDHCNGGTCGHEPCTDCCAGELACVVGFGCAAGEQPCADDDECDDGIRCTLDRCMDHTRCEHVAQDPLCGDEQICFSAVGCIPRPPETCETAVDCSPDYCSGEWSCQPEFGCQFVGSRNCDDGDACTDDRCSEERDACTHDVRDADEDGFGDEACGASDCADEDRARHPGAEEVCNALDDNCDGTLDPPCCDAGMDCTTECATTGVRICNDEGLEECRPPLDTCSALDEDCDGEVDEDFACIRGASGTCTTECGSTGSQACNLDCTLAECAEPPESCNGRDDDCDGESDNGFDCVRGSIGSCPTTCGSTGQRTCLSSCSWDTCDPPPETCNGVDDDCDSACDDGFTCCAGGTTPCSTLGFATGTATCQSDCSGWNTSLCSRCGNGTINAGEDCDGTALGGESCTTVPGGFTGGTLRCDSACDFDTGMCTTAGFDPSGTYLVSPAPSYSCAIGLVNFNIATATIVDSGSNMVVTGPPCPMTGLSAATSRTISASCTLSGSCDETYTLTGSYTTDDQFTGSFQVTFSGSCFDCGNQSWPITATR